MSISNFLENTLLDLVFNASAYAGQSTVYVQLHVGDPGETGTSNVAGETTRKAVTFAGAVGGSVVSDSAATWASVAAAETYTHISLWDAASGGNCLWTGSLTSDTAVALGQAFTLASGDLTASLD